MIEDRAIPTPLDELCDFYAGVADESTHRRVAATLEQANSPQSLLLGAVDASARDLLGSRTASVWDRGYYSRFGRAYLRRHSLVAAVLISIVMTGGWAFITPKPVLRDNFSENWFHPGKWREQSRPVVRFENGYARLQNRGFLVTKKEYREPIELSLDWRWIDLKGDPLYTDDLTVALRSHGQPRGDRPWEATDGILVRFSSGPSRVSIGLGAAVGDMEGLAVSAPAIYPMPSNVWRKIRIVDTGESIEVYLSGDSYYPNADAQTPLPRDDREPILTVAYDEPFSAGHIAIYNREYVGDSREHAGGVPHESHIDNVRIYRLEDVR